jgi:hypothetical protein
MRMAIGKPEVEWFYHDMHRWHQVGVVCIGGRWAGVEETDFDCQDPFKVVTPWVDDRKTAIGFLKLLKEN